MKRTLLLIMLTACGAPTDPGGSGGGSAGAGTGGGAAGAGGGTTGTGGGAGSALLSVSECEQDMNRFAAAHCSDEMQWTLARTMVCPKIPTATSALCAAPLAKAKTCHTPFQQAVIACNAGGVTDTFDTCAIDVLLGVFCVASVNSNLCYATPCMYNTDCPSGYSCNDKTEHCFKNDAPCLGLPCRYNIDCPGGYTCNNAIEQCVRS